MVRSGFDRVRACYDDGVRRNAALQGRVVVRFVIERDGSVKKAVDDGSQISDAAVRDCVFREFSTFKFPAPETGIVTVVYPIMLAPG